MDVDPEFLKEFHQKKYGSILEKMDKDILEKGDCDLSQFEFKKLPWSIKSALHGVNCYSFFEVSQLHDITVLLRSRRFGEGKLNRIKRILAQQGLTWKD